MATEKTCQHGIYDLPGDEVESGIRTFTPSVLLSGEGRFSLPLKKRKEKSM